ncbi:alpha/beta hydrolase [Streptomyces sp. NPDC088254]|uniref:alpha/beta hydrolase n=1 Tax=Streptomyces sp. NPDC088254 TaxID=3365847 RepID=UPI0037FBC07F
MQEDTRGRRSRNDATPEAEPRSREPGSRLPRRCLRALLAVLITAAIAVPLSAAARPRVPAPPPADLAPLTAQTLPRTYAANRANAELASRMAAEHGDRHRAGADHALAGPSRDLLAFDGRGTGRAIEILGDLAGAERVAILIPGSDTSLDTYERFHRAAAALHRSLAQASPAGRRTAVIAWLGYTTPRTVSTTAATADRAEEAAPELREFVHDLRAVTGPSAHISLLCHSYGSVVCGRAADGLDVDDLVLLGSPGTGADSAGELGTRARVWAARGADDWVAEVPHAEVDLFGTKLGFGTDPMSPSFGADLFTAGPGGHSDYFRPRSESLTNITRIVLGRTEEVTHA